MNAFRVGLVWHGDRANRDTADLATSRFARASEALRSAGLEPVAVVYNDDFSDEVLTQMLSLDAIQVWVNPIENGRDRSKLDSLLREVALRGVLVNTHPDSILKMGTKQVLVETKEMGWGSDVWAYTSLEQLENELPARLENGPRVLKQLRGHSGSGIWKVEMGDTGEILLRHAQRGSPEEKVSLIELKERMLPYFESSGKMIDQAFQSRLAEGITRVYMVESQVGGFGHQEINALYPSFPGCAIEDTPQPGPRLYSPPGEDRFRHLGNKMESQWVPELLSCLKIKQSDLPLLWDADFMLGPKNLDGSDTYVLCEINVSCVSPYPEWANPILVATLARRIRESIKNQ